MYVYFAGYAPAMTTISEKAADRSNSLVIVGEAYGGCSMTNFCPSFQVAADGTYRYFYLPQGADEQVLREGELPSVLQKELRRVVTAAELQVASLPIEPALCESYRDGIDVKYRVTLGGSEYTIDSCGTDVNGEGAMWVTLSQIWRYFETI